MELLIDTTSPRVGIGLVRDGQLFAEETWDASHRLSEELAERIRTLLASQGETVSDVRSIRVHAGPGGFTRVRIGVVTANTLAFALRVPVKGVVGDIPSLQDLLEHEATSTGEVPVIPVYDRPLSLTAKHTTK
jgi:tRNA threonylcarbamoyl adenosine modification protein YeaZ